VLGVLVEPIDDVTMVTVFLFVFPIVVGGVGVGV